MAYGAVVSLKQTIESVLRSPESLIVLPNSEIESISEQLGHFQSFIETIKLLPSSDRIDASSEKRVKDAAKEFEDLIDSHISDLFLSGTDHSSSLTSDLSEQLLKVNREITALTQKLMTGDEEDQRQQQQQPSDDSYDCKHYRVELQRQLEGWIFNLEADLQVLLIWGMAGIGKTTLVRQLFYSPDVQSCFGCYSFVSVGPRCELQELLLLILRQMSFNDGRKGDEILLNNENGCSLGDLLHRTLSKNSFLIVLDNMWNKEVWDQLKVSFPRNFNINRVILTSRLLDFYLDDYRMDCMEIPLLNDDESWNLLHKLVFTSEEQCSRQLEKIGRKIAKNCEGLPLAIIEVGKLLCNMDKTVRKWKVIAEKEDPLTITKDDKTPLSEALFLSYRMLPQYLKVCFLYMAVFPKNYHFRPLQLFNLWFYEGFLELQEKRSLEETALGCLYRLQSKSVVLANEMSSTKKTKSCRLHFTFRNMCANEAISEKFFGIIKKYKDESFPEELNNQNRLCIHNNIILGFKQVHSWMESILDVRTLLCLGSKQQYPIVLYLGFRLLKILDAVAIRFYEFPHQVLDLVHLKYLSVTYDGEIPSSISRLWNLEVLIVSRHHNIKRSSNLPVYLPMEIWKLHKLKHLQCMGLDLPDPSSTDDDSLILEQLLTLSGVSAHSCTVGVIARIPNLMKIGIKIELAHDSVETFSFLGGDRFASLYENFESFKCVVVYPSLIRSPEIVSSIPINFPVNVRKITLSGCGFPWEYMKVIAELPNLETLKLRWYAFCSAEWHMNNGGFRKLNYLLLEDLDLEFLMCFCRHIPALENLIIRHCYKLERLPPFLGRHKHLELIEVIDCMKFIGDEIQEQKKRCGNTRLQLRVHSSRDDNKNPKPELEELD